MNTAEAIRAAIMEMYVETGKPATAAEIATRCGMTQTKVTRTLVDAQEFALDGIEMTEETRPAYSRNYPWMVTGERAVRVFAPTREAMRAELIRARAAR
jgi:DNA-directed RNA polymerase specialized sigma subunit